MKGLSANLCLLSYTRKREDREQLDLHNPVQSKTTTYWTGLFVAAISFIVFFGTLWYSIFPNNDNSILNNPFQLNSQAVGNIISAMPILVGAEVFIVIGTHIAMSGRKKDNSTAA